MKETNEELLTVIKLLGELKSKIDDVQPKKYYRNKHLKQFFNLSDNTIIDYRDKNIIPFSKIGEIYFYPMEQMDLLLTKNSNYDMFNTKF